jgi:hypothetical protein
VNYGLPGPQTVLQGAKEGIIGVVNEIVSTVSLLLCMKERSLLLHA